MHVDLWQGSVYTMADMHVIESCDMQRLQHPLGTFSRMWISSRQAQGDTLPRPPLCHANQHLPHCFEAAPLPPRSDMAQDSAEVQVGDRLSMPRYKAVIEDEEHERLDALLGTLQHKDEMQQRMEAVTHLTVTAWRCATCNSTTDKRRPSCQVSHAPCRISQRLALELLGIHTQDQRPGCSKACASVRAVWI